MGDDAAVLVPSAPGAAPRLRTPPAELDAFRQRLISLTAPAGLAGLPQARRVPRRHREARLGTCGMC